MKFTADLTTIRRTFAESMTVNETFSVERTKQKTNKPEIEESLRWLPTLVRSDMARRRVSWIE